MRYLSLFSGIEGASVAWEPLGWEPMAFSEIEPFPSAVLRERYPDVPNLGDVTKIDWSDFLAQHGRPDLVIGGSPCQSFSIAGTRTGLSGASGLMYEYIRAVRELRPRWLLWENVPGALSVEQGHAFGQLLSSLDDCGYGLAWRVLDAQFCRVAVWDDTGELVGFVGPVAQRRRRVFLVGCLADGCAAEVLLESEGMPGNLESSREKRQELARAAGRGAEGGRLTAFKYIAGAKAGQMPAYDDGSTPTITADWHAPAIAINQSQDPIVTYERCHTLDHNGAALITQYGEEVAGTLTARHDSSPCVDRGQNIVAVAIPDTHTPTRSLVLRMHSGKAGGGKGPLIQEDVSGTLATGNDQSIFVMASAATNAEILNNLSPTLLAHMQKEPPILIDRAAFNQGVNAQYEPHIEKTEVCDTLIAKGPHAIAYEVPPILFASEPNAIDVRNLRVTLQSKANGGYSLNYQNPVSYEDPYQADAVTISDGSKWVVRRLTPVECERLMGFPDGWTDIGEWVDDKGKKHKSADGPRYKALGNSFATPVIRWIGERIDETDIWARVSIKQMEMEDE